MEKELQEAKGAIGDTQHKLVEQSAVRAGFLPALSTQGPGLTLLIHSSWVPCASPEASRGWMSCIEVLGHVSLSREFVIPRCSSLRSFLL